jgi:hypothetical protein
MYASNGRRNHQACLDFERFTNGSDWYIGTLELDGHMLTDEEKSRIRLEEIFRREVQVDLQGHAKNKRGKTFWEFINSAFFLWFLSTILIGTGSLLYTRWEKKKEDEKRVYEKETRIVQEKAAMIREIDAEISSRLNYFGIKAPIDLDDPVPLDMSVAKALLILDKPSEADYPVNVMPEYASRSLQSLLLELLQLSPENERAELQEAYQAAKTLPSIYSYDAEIIKSLDAGEAKSKNSPMSEDFHLLVAKFRHNILHLRHLNLERWGNPFGPEKLATQE